MHSLFVVARNAISLRIISSTLHHTKDDNENEINCFDRDPPSNGLSLDSFAVISKCRMGWMRSCFISYRKYKHKKKKKTINK